MGILDKLKSIVSNNDQEFKEAILHMLKEVSKEEDVYLYNVNVTNLKFYQNSVNGWDSTKKINFLIYCIKTTAKYFRKKSYKYGSPDYQFNQIAEKCMAPLVKTNIEFDSVSLSKLLDTIKEYTTHEYHLYSHYPVKSIVLNIERLFKNREVPPDMLNILIEFKAYIIKNASNASYDKDKLKLIERIDNLAFNKEENTVKPTYFLGDDEFTAFANNTIKNCKDTDKIIWFQLIAKAQKVSGAKPSKKYMDETKVLINELGTDKFKKTVNEWFEFVINMKEKTTEHTNTYNKQTYTYSTIEFVSPINSEAIKGFVWMSSHFYDNQTIQNLSKLAERCYKKIPGKGPAAGAIGNACLFSLYNSKGLDGIGQLSRLKVRIKQNNTQILIQNYIESAAQKLGMSTIEIEDLAVEDFGLVDASREYKIEEFVCKLEITGVGKSVLRWFKSDNSEQKSVPVMIKDKHAAKLKKIKDTQKQIDQTTTAQRDRLDRMLRSNRTMALDYFIKHYLEHGLMSFLAKKIIWNFTKDAESITAINIENAWVTSGNNEINIRDYSSVSLWHPAMSNTADVKKWRDFLYEHKFQQPLKQAFREIYILTEAEMNTRTYSNRMASHVLKQHQYVTLAKGRSWSARLIGAWDGGDQDTATLQLPEYNLRAEYWVNALNADDAFNDTGIWNYVTTDQVRFINTLTNELVDLVDVPPVPFSEVLRDVDLFVGVASVGNDPTWSDSGGLPAYRDYWQSYSFGDLSEVAKNRKEILTGLIPRLKIASVTSIFDKFVVVKGKLRTYKIHIGSTNILMEPNDQYLCIVADRSQKSFTENIFLPFEGDNGLSVILSKAFLLAEDDKITDSSITSQINR